MKKGDNWMLVYSLSMETVTNKSLKICLMERKRKLTNKEGKERMKKWKLKDKRITS